MISDLTVTIESQGKQYKFTFRDIDISDSSAKNLGEVCREFIQQFDSGYLAKTLVPGVGMGAAILSVVREDDDIRARVIERLRAKGL